MFTTLSQSTSAQNVQQHEHTVRNKEVTQTNTCAEFRRVQTSVLSSFNKFQQVPAKLHVNCKSKYCTKYYGAAGRHNPAAQSAIAHGRLHKTIPKRKTTPIPGHSNCVPAVPKLHRRSSGSETTCRAVAARGFHLF